MAAALIEGKQGWRLYQCSLQSGDQSIAGVSCTGANSLPSLRCCFHGITLATSPGEVGRDWSRVSAGTIARKHGLFNLQMSKENVEIFGLAGNTSCWLDT